MSNLAEQAKNAQRHAAHAANNYNQAKSNKDQVRQEMENAKGHAARPQSANDRFGK